MAIPENIAEFLALLAKGISCSFGRDCEVIVHDLTTDDHSSTVIAIENGHVTGRKVGDGLPSAVLADLEGTGDVKTEMAYFARTEDGRLIKDTGVTLRDEDGKPLAIFAINYDITMLTALNGTISDLISLASSASAAEDDPTQTVGGLLDSLIEQSVELVGKPVALMDRADKIRAIGFLNGRGAFLITKSGQRVCEYFGISKYTLYSYLDEYRQKDEA